MASPESRLDFFHYAVKYWPLHAREARTGLRLDSPNLQALLRGTSLLMRWVRAYTTMSKTFIQLDLQLPNPLAVLAEHGLDAVLTAIMANHLDALWYSDEPSVALIVAATCGETNIVRLLLNRIAHDKFALERAISAAFPLQDGEVILELLVTRLLNKAQGSDDISAALDRAARSGRYGIV